MQTTSGYRDWHFDSMRKNLLIMSQIIVNIIDESVFDKRDGEDGWTISEVLGHLAAVEAIFLERAQLTMNEDNPQLPFSDPNQQVIDLGFASQDALDILQQWKDNRMRFLAYLQSLPTDDATWERTAQHPRRGAFTLFDQLSLASWHDTNHIHQIIKIIHG